MPYSVGLQAASAAFLSAGFATQFTIAVVTLVVILLITSSLQKDKEDSPVRLPGYSLLAIYPFFRRRFDFFNASFRAAGQSVFQFQLLRVRWSIIFTSVPLLTANFMLEFSYRRIWRVSQTDVLHH